MKRLGILFGATGLFLLLRQMGKTTYPGKMSVPRSTPFRPIDNQWRRGQPKRA